MSKKELTKEEMIGMLVASGMSVIERCDELINSKSFLDESKTEFKNIASGLRDTMKRIELDTLEKKQKKKEAEEQKESEKKDSVE